jgi:hypothetical protein
MRLIEGTLRNTDTDKKSLAGGASIGEMVLCIKENDITTHGGFGLCSCARASEGCRRREGVVFKMLWLYSVAEKQRCLATIYNLKQLKI